MSEQPPVLSIADLTVSRPRDPRPALDNLSLAIEAGETVIVLGEAGSGIDALMRALNRALDEGETATGTIRFGGQTDRSRFAGPPVRSAYLPGPSCHPLSPHASAGSQIARAVARRMRTPQSSARTEFVQELQRLEGAPPPAAFDRRAGELTPEVIAWGLLAAALAQAPQLLLVDRFFEGLAPQASRVLERALVAAKSRLKLTLLVATMSTETALRLGGRLIVLRQGRIVEEGPVLRLASAQAHAYTRTLFRNAAPRERSATRGESVVQALGISLMTGPRGRNELNFELRRGASLALVGEAGSGRRALMRLILGMQRLERGRIVFDAVDIGILSPKMMSRLRRRVAIIAGADDVLDPRMTLWETVAEPLRAHLHLPRDVVANYRDSALRRVGLASLPGETPIASLSVFDRRRLQVARAIVTAPALAIIDEPFRDLDAFAKSVIRDLLQSFRAEEGPAFLVITSDFAVAKALTDEAMIFRNGMVVERGPVADLLRAPKNPYTRSLVEAYRLPPNEGLPPASSGV